MACRQHSATTFIMFSELQAIANYKRMQHSTGIVRQSVPDLAIDVPDLGIRATFHYTHSGSQNWFLCIHTITPIPTVLVLNDLEFEDFFRRRYFQQKVY
jgi:hypothetical protein